MENNGVSKEVAEDLSAEINYDAAPVRVTVNFKQGERVRKLVIIESADAVIRHRNAVMSAARMEGQPGTDGFRMTGVSGIADAEPILVQACLRENPRGAEGDPRDDKVLSMSFVRETLPPSLLAAIFDRAKRINGIDKGAKAEVELGKE